MCSETERGVYISTTHNSAQKTPYIFGIITIEHAIGCCTANHLCMVENLKRKRNAHGIDGGVREKKRNAREKNLNYRFENQVKNARKVSVSNWKLFVYSSLLLGPWCPCPCMCTDVHVHVGTCTHIHLM